MTELKITQADRDSAASYWGNDNPPVELRQAFARHRIAAEEGKAELVEALGRIATLTTGRDTDTMDDQVMRVFRAHGIATAALARVRGEG